MRGMSLQSNLSEHVLRALYELNLVFLCFDLLVLFSLASGRYLNSQLRRRSWFENKGIASGNFFLNLFVLFLTLALRDEDKYEPRRQKTGLWGLRPAPRQTGLYNHRTELEA